MLAIEGPGSSFAKLPVFDGGNYPAAAAASEDAELLFISRKDFQNFCREHPEVALKVIAVVGARLRRLVGIIEELSFTTVRQRLIALLLQLAEAEGTRSDFSHCPPTRLPADYRMGGHHEFHKRDKSQRPGGGKSGRQEDLGRRGR